MITIHTFLVPTAACALSLFLLFSTLASFRSRHRADTMHRHLTHLWRIAIALLLAAIYLEIRQ